MEAVEKVIRQICIDNYQSPLIIDKNPTNYTERVSSTQMCVALQPVSHTYPLGYKSPTRQLITSKFRKVEDFCWIFLFWKLNTGPMTIRVPTAETLTDLMAEGKNIYVVGLEHPNGEGTIG